MAGLRQRQAEKRREIILAVAQDLFREKGYSATNVEEIANRAEVGIATIYKYFGAKGGLIRELWRPKIEEFRRAGDAVIANPPDSAGEAVANLLDQYRFGDKWQHRELLLAVAGMELGYAEIFQGIRQELDNQIINHLEALFAQLERSGKLIKGLDHNDLAIIVYGVFNYHFQFYTVHEEVSLERVREDLRRSILLLFRNWLPGDQTKAKPPRIRRTGA